MKLTTKTVSNTIKGWSILFPSQHRGQAQEAFIAKEFYEELQDIYSDEEFVMAAKMVKRSCKFFPTIADMYSVKDDVYAELSRRKRKPSKSLPEYTEPDTPEEKKLAEKRLAIISKATKGLITYEEATAQLQDMVGYAQ